MKPIPVIVNPDVPVSVIAHRACQQGYKLKYMRRRLWMVPLQRKEKTQ